LGTDGIQNIFPVIALVKARIHCHIGIQVLQRVVCREFVQGQDIHSVYISPRAAHKIRIDAADIILPALGIVLHLYKHHLVVSLPAGSYYRHGGKSIHLHFSSRVKSLKSPCGFLKKILIRHGIISANCYFPFNLAGKEIRTKAFLRRLFFPPAARKNYKRC